MLGPFGADNDAVLAELLGLDDEAIAALRADGVLLGTPPPRRAPGRCVTTVLDVDVEAA